MSAPPGTGGLLPASPRVLGIVGLGLIGTSVALAARRRWPDVHIIGVDHPPVLLQPKVVAALDVAAPDLPALKGADVIVLATPVDAIVSTLQRLPDIVSEPRLVIDTGSTKRDIMAAARLAGVPSFVGGHPMAGAAGAGAELARADLFDNRVWLLIESADDALLSAARAFVEALGARPIVASADTHDAVMAAVSHTPQIVASLLMTLVAEKVEADGLAWSGGGLRDTTRLAASPPGMWTSVLATNADLIAPLLVDLAARLHALAGSLGDKEVVERVLRDASHARARLDAADLRAPS